MLSFWCGSAFGPCSTALRHVQARMTYRLFARISFNVDNLQRPTCQVLPVYYLVCHIHQSFSHVGGYVEQGVCWIRCVDTWKKGGFIFVACFSLVSCCNAASPRTHLASFFKTGLEKREIGKNEGLRFIHFNTKPTKNISNLAPKSRHI